MSTISERVQRGAEFLDAKLPDWWKTHGIDLSTFDMAMDCDCVIGQLSPDKDYGVAVRAHWLDMTQALAVELGFYSREQARADPYLDDDDTGTAIQREYDQLTSEWRRVITERRAAA